MNGEVPPEFPSPYFPSAKAKGRFQPAPCILEDPWRFGLAAGSFSGACDTAGRPGFGTKPLGSRVAVLKGLCTRRILRIRSFGRMTVSWGVWDRRMLFFFLFFLVFSFIYMSWFFLSFINFLLLITSFYRVSMCCTRDPMKVLFHDHKQFIVCY